MDTLEQKNENEEVVVEAENTESLEAKYDLYIEQIKDEQNFTSALLWGFLAALAGAIIWALVTAAIKVQIGWMAVGVGFLVGFAVKKFGKGVDKIFGFVGAGLALIGCLLGNLFTIVIMASFEYDITLFEILSGLDLMTTIEIMKETFHPMDLLFYGIAIYEGYKFSFREITEEELSAIDN